MYGACVLPLMLDQLWFSIRIIKTVLLESIPMAESLDTPAKMQNNAITGTRRFIIPSCTLRTMPRREKKRSYNFKVTGRAFEPRKNTHRAKILQLSQAGRLVEG